MLEMLNINCVHANATALSCGVKLVCRNVIVVNRCTAGIWLPHAIAVGPASRKYQSNAAWLACSGPMRAVPRCQRT